MNPKNEQETRRLIEKIVSDVLPKVIRDSNNNIRTGIVNKVTFRTVDVVLDGTNQTITGVKFQQGASPIQGSFATVISSDPNLRGQVRAIIF